MGLSRMCAKGCSETEPKPSRGSCVAITNVRVFDGDKICEPSIVIIKGELIGSSEMVPTETVDAQGGVLLPGLIDCHIHLTGTDDLVRMTEYGVTTAFDMATWPAELLKSLRGQKGLTDIKA
ncbi:amidohydrolase, partial [Gregarina niphandrodes]